MNWFLRGLLRPTNNRHYNPYHRRHYLLINLPSIAVIILLGIFLNPKYFLLLVLYPIDYFILDRASDKIAWQLFWRHLYKDEIYTPQEHEALMKEYEKNPSPENLQKLSENLAKQKS